MQLRKLFLPLLALLLLLAACAVKPAPLAQPVTVKVDGLTLTLRLADDRLTEPLEVLVTVRNEGETDARWGGSSSCPDPTRVTARLPDGREGSLHPVWPNGSAEPRMCTADFVEHRLKPGESLQSRWRWDGKVIENPGTPQYREVEAPKGALSIVAAFPIGEAKSMEAVMALNRPE